VGRPRTATARWSLPGAYSSLVVGRWGCPQPPPLLPRCSGGSGRPAVALHRPAGGRWRCARPRPRRHAVRGLGQPAVNRLGQDFPGESVFISLEQGLMTDLRQHMFRQYLTEITSLEIIGCGCMWPKTIVAEYENRIPYLLRPWPSAAVACGCRGLRRPWPSAAVAFCGRGLRRPWPSGTPGWVCHIRASTGQ